MTAEERNNLYKRVNEAVIETSDILQKNASNKCNTEIWKAQNFYNGYQQGIEDLLKCTRRN